MSVMKMNWANYYKKDLAKAVTKQPREVELFKLGNKIQVVPLAELLKMKNMEVMKGNFTGKDGKRYSLSLFADKADGRLYMSKERKLEVIKKHLKLQRIKKSQRKAA